MYATNQMMMAELLYKSPSMVSHSSAVSQPASTGSKKMSPSALSTPSSSGRRHTHNPYCPAVIAAVQYHQPIQAGNSPASASALSLSSDLPSPDSGRGKSMPSLMLSFSPCAGAPNGGLQADTQNSSFALTNSSSQCSSCQPPNYDVKVKNLPRDCDKAELRELFETYFGPVEESLVMLDKKQKSRGFGYVSMVHYKDALYAVRQLNSVGLQLRGRILTAHISKTRSHACDCLAAKPEQGSCSSSSRFDLSITSAPTPTKVLSAQHDETPNHADGTGKTYRTPLPPAFIEGMAWNDEVDQEDVVSQIVARVRELSRMQLPLKEKRAKKYFHRFLESGEAPQQLKEDFEKLSRFHQMAVYRALCE